VTVEANSTAHESYIQEDEQISQSQTEQSQIYANALRERTISHESEKENVPICVERENIRNEQNTEQNARAGRPEVVREAWASCPGTAENAQEEDQRNIQHSSSDAEDSPVEDEETSQLEEEAKKAAEAEEKAEEELATELEDVGFLYNVIFM